MKWSLPVPEGPQTLRARSTRVRAAPAGDLGDRRGVLLPRIECLAREQSGGYAPYLDRRVVASGGLLAQQDTDMAQDGFSPINENLVEVSRPGSDPAWTPTLRKINY